MGRSEAKRDPNIGLVRDPWQLGFQEQAGKLIDYYRQVGRRIGPLADAAAENSYAPIEGGLGLGPPFASQEDCCEPVPAPIAGLVDCRAKSEPGRTSNGSAVMFPVV